MIHAKIVKDSINAITGSRLTTFVVTFPRFINAEILRHRSLSFNSASSRAIPVEKMLEEIKNNPAAPIEWGKHQPGMQANELVPPETAELARTIWMSAMESALAFSSQLRALGVAKQISNRITEPFQNITLVISGTCWENFFYLRASALAQPELRSLAEEMLRLYNNNQSIDVITPVEYPEIEKNPLDCAIINKHIPDDSFIDKWHLPFSEYAPENATLEHRLKISTARCARTSYLNHDATNILPEKDVELHDKLKSSGHFSPFEHCAVCCLPYQNMLADPSNFGSGWLQYRKFFNNENKSDPRVINRSPKISVPVGQ